MARVVIRGILMNQEILDFYADKNLHINKMIDRRPQGLTPEQVKAAASVIYDKLQEKPDSIKCVQIAHEVFRCAKKMKNTEKFIEDKKVIKQELLHQEIQDETKQSLQKIENFIKAQKQFFDENNKIIIKSLGKILGDLEIIQQKKCKYSDTEVLDKINEEFEKLIPKIEGLMPKIEEYIIGERLKFFSIILVIFSIIQSTRLIWVSLF